MTDPAAFRFPFGRPVLPCRPAADGARRVFVLGAYPSALHVRWTSPDAAIRALPVDNEPEPFWDGADEAARFDTWRRAVGFDPVAHGEAVPAGRRNNGPSGAGLDADYLVPLGLRRSDCWITDCLDTYRMSRGVEQALQQRFARFAEAAGLRPPVLPAHPDERAIVGLALGLHADRLRAEFAEAAPEVVLTLGNAALRVLRTVLDAREPPARLSPAGYGRPTVARAGSRVLRWYALAHPGAMSKLGRWQDAHRSWKQTAQRARPVTYVVEASGR
jgi:hypothetical protein